MSYGEEIQEWLQQQLKNQPKMESIAVTMAWQPDAAADEPLHAVFATQGNRFTPAVAIKLIRKLMLLMDYVMTPLVTGSSPAEEPTETTP